MTRALLLLLFMGLLPPGVTPAQAASFNCAEARKPDEVAICKNRDLSELDSEMGALWFAFSRVPMLMGGSGDRQDDANDFLQKRATCGSDVACLRTLYRARISALKNDLSKYMNFARQDQNGTPSASTSTLPAPVQKIIDGYTDQCRHLGGSLSGTNRPKIMTDDLDGDGKPDYVLNPENLRCSAAATAFCGNGGCQITIAVSGNGYQQPINLLGGQPTLSQQSTGTSLDVWVDRSNCNLPNRENACWVIYSWKDGKATKTYQAKPLPK